MESFCLMIIRGMLLDGCYSLHLDGETWESIWVVNIQYIPRQEALLPFLFLFFLGRGSKRRRDYAVFYVLIDIYLYHFFFFALIYVECSNSRNFVCIWLTSELNHSKCNHRETELWASTNLHSTSQVWNFFVLYHLR